MVQHGFPEAFADGFLTLQAEAVGQPAFIAGEVSQTQGYLQVLRGACRNDHLRATARRRLARVLRRRQPW